MISEFVTLTDITGKMNQSSTTRSAALVMPYLLTAVDTAADHQRVNILNRISCYRVLLQQNTLRPLPSDAYFPASRLSEEIIHVVFVHRVAVDGHLGPFEPTLKVLRRSAKENVDVELLCNSDYILYIDAGASELALSKSTSRRPGGHNWRVLDTNWANIFYKNTDPLYIYMETAFNVFCSKFNIDPDETGFIAWAHVTGKDFLEDLYMADSAF